MSERRKTETHRDWTASDVAKEIAPWPSPATSLAGPVGKRPPHPGELFREDWKRHRLSMEQVAAASGISVGKLMLLWDEKCAVWGGMAKGLARAFGTSPDFWLDAQADYDRAPDGTASEAPRAPRVRARAGGGRRVPRG